MGLIDKNVLYERATTLEAQALDYVGKLIERDGDEPSVEWRIWSAILTERSAFKFDLMDAPTIDAVEVVRCKECKHRDKEHSYMCTYLGDIVFDDGEGFCCKGERNIR